MAGKLVAVALMAPWLGLQDAKQDAPPPNQVPQPKLVVVGETTVQLDKIREGDKVNAVFTIENQGEADLVIDHVKSGCGCTAVELKDKEKVIPPGKRQQIVARFDSKGRPGLQTKSITVYSNDRENPRLKLTFKVRVETLFSTVPHTKYDFRSVRRGEQLAKYIDIVASGMVEGAMEVVSFKIPGGLLHHSIGPVPESEEGRAYRVTLTADEDAKLGYVQAIAEITVKIGEQTETRGLKVGGRIVGDLEVKPPMTKLEQPAARGTQLRQVVVSSTTNEPFEVFEVSAGPDFDTLVEPADGKTEYTVKISIADQAADGPCGTFLKIRTDSVMQPLIRVPVFAFVAPRVSVEPPVVLLRTDPERQFTGRRVALQNMAGEDFNILEVSTTVDFLEAEPITRGSAPRGGRYVQVSLKDGVANAAGQGTVIVKTDIPGAEVLEIPVVVTGPAR